MKSKLHILHVIGGGDFGGAEQHILNLIANFPKDELEATVVCFYDAVFAAKLRDAGIRVVTLTRYGRFDFRLLHGLRQVIRQYNPDIIHSHGVKANFFCRLAADHSTTAVITTMHSYLRYDYVNRLAYFIVTTMERTTRFLNRHYIAVSQGIYDILRREGVPPEKISLIYNGIHLEPFRQMERRSVDRATLLQEWALPTDAFVFGTVARFVPVKALPDLLEAFSLLVQRHPDKPFRLVLIGDGVERPSLEETAKQLQIEPYVVFTGYRSDIPACLHAFDAFVISSLHEGLPYTILEAIASEVPVVATAVGGIKEFIQNGQTGLLVPPASPAELSQQMERIAADKELRAQLIKQGLQHLEQSFTIQQMATRTVELYKKIALDKS